MLCTSALAALFTTAIAQSTDCSGFGTTWGPGIAPPPTGCGGGGGAATTVGGGGGGGGSSSSHAAPLLGDVGRTTVSGTDARSGVTFPVGENIYGPFEAGFGAQQNFILEGLGCADGNDGHVAGGIDTHTAEQMVAAQCGITLPRIEGSEYISLIDECGGHTREYHFHERLSCLFKAEGAHSTKVGEAEDGQPLYGKWEDYEAEMLPQLDACGGHYGITPDSDGKEVYHYHVQDAAPFTIGCFGPNDDGSLVTVQQCRDFYDGCDGDLVDVVTPAGTKQYDLWCPCYDADGSNTGININELAVFASTDTGLADEEPLTPTTVTPAPVIPPAPAPAPPAITTQKAAVSTKTPMVTTTASTPAGDMGLATTPTTGGSSAGGRKSSGMTLRPPSHPRSEGMGKGKGGKRPRRAPAVRGRQVEV